MRIVFQTPGEPMAIIIPCECGLTIEQIGQKDVPAGLPFWVVPVDAVPADRTFRDAWELDVQSMGAPSGIGGTYQPQEDSE